MSLAVVMTPFVGQNFGAGKLDRVKKGINVSIKLALWSSLVVYIVLFIAGGHIGAIYSDDPQVIEALVFYLRTVPLFYGAYGIIQITMSVLNAINRPFQAALISLTLMFVIYIPLASVSRTVWGYQGIFLALALSYFVVAIISLFWLKRTIAHVYKI